MAVTTVEDLLELIVARDRDAVLQAVLDVARDEGLSAVIALLALPWVVVRSLMFRAHNSS